MIIVSIDCGIKNLAYSVIEVKEPIFRNSDPENFVRTNSWKVIDINNVNISGRGLVAQYQNLVRVMNNIKLSHSDVVLIEKQMAINSKMFGIFSSIVTYFLTIPGGDKRKIFIIHPNLKNKLIRSVIDLDGRKRIKFLSSYKYNKSCAVDFIHKLNTVIPGGWVSISEYNKKDDVCDCLIQMLAYLLKK